jgi:hypothetical protein
VGFRNSVRGLSGALGWDRPDGPSLTATIVLSRGTEGVPRSLRVSVEAHDAEATPSKSARSAGCSGCWPGQSAGSAQVSTTARLR